MRTTNVILLIFTLFVSCKDETPAELYAGCCDTAPQQLTIGVEVVSIPNAFSPNGDGINDVFFPFATAGVALIQEFQVLDRNKKQMAKYINVQPNDVGLSWNGIYSGGSTYEGLFYYKVSAVTFLGDTKTIEGSACSIVCNPNGTLLPVSNPDGCGFLDQFNNSGQYDPGILTADQKCF